MINQNIIRELNSYENSGNSEDMLPSHFIAIDEISQTHECGQDSIKFKLYRINKSLKDIISEDDAVYYNKTFTVLGKLSSDNLGNFTSEIIGYISSDNKAKRLILDNDEETEIDVPKEPHSHHIEMVQTGLKSEINITFDSPQKSIPSVIVNIDKQYESLYSSQSTVYKKDINENYSGVQILFKNLKTRRTYPDIKITIIGDAIYTSDDSDTEEEEG